MTDKRFAEKASAGISGKGTAKKIAEKKEGSSTRQGQKDPSLPSFSFADNLRKALQEFPGQGYAIVLPLLEQDGGLSLLFEVRNRNIAQGGEVCFPGGKIEENESASAAAVRETCEELKIREDQLELLGPLPDCLHSPLGIHAFLAVLHEYPGSFAPDEVERVFTVPLKELLKEIPKEEVIVLERIFPEDFPFELIPQGKDYPFRQRKETIFFYPRKEALIWGLTASLLHTFLEILRTCPGLP